MPTWVSQPFGFSVYYPEFWLPKLYRPRWLVKFSFRQRLKRARSLLMKRGCQWIILHLWRPEFADALSSVPFNLSCYHIDDEYSFSDNALSISEVDFRLITAVNQVFVISPGLLEKKGGINSHTALVPEGVDYRDYANTVTEPTDLALVPRPRIGYTGILKKQLDWPLLLNLTQQHPEW